MYVYVYIYTYMEYVCIYIYIVKNGTQLQYASLENSMGRGTWWATVHGVAKSQT